MAVVEAEVDHKDECTPLRKVLQGLVVPEEGSRDIR